MSLTTSEISSICSENVQLLVLKSTSAIPENGNYGELQEVTVDHCNIIKQSFWKAHPSILGEIPDDYVSQITVSHLYFREISINKRQIFVGHMALVVFAFEGTQSSGFYMMFNSASWWLKLVGVTVTNIYYLSRNWMRKPGVQYK